MILVRTAAALALVVSLSACAGVEVGATDAEIQGAVYVPEGPPTVTLLTAISNSSGAGGHSALLIDGQYRVLFDPAGSWHHPMIPERGDVLYGMAPAFYGFYMDYHARETYHMVVQTLEIPPATAAALIAAVQANGPVAAAQCSASISRILSNTPGFEPVNPTMFPRAMMDRFGTIPGVRTEIVYDDDSDDNLELLQRQARMATVQTNAEILAGN